MLCLLFASCRLADNLQGIKWLYLSFWTRTCFNTTWEHASEDVGSNSGEGYLEKWLFHCIIKKHCTVHMQTLCSYSWGTLVSLEAPNYTQSSICKACILLFKKFTDLKHLEEIVPFRYLQRFVHTLPICCSWSTYSCCTNIDLGFIYLGAVPNTKTEEQ